MKVIKPRKLGALYRFYEDRNRFHICVSALFFFAFSPDGLLLKDEQAMWALAGGQLGDTVLDDCLPKTNGEFLVCGDCHTAGGQPAQEALVSAKVGDLEKRLAVYGDRYWLKSGDHFDRLRGKGWEASQAKPFRQMPLAWAQAFGGEGFAHNPLGKGYLPPEEEPAEAAHPLPNLELPGQMMAGPWALPAPAGFMPIDIGWPQRASKTGTVDEAWARDLFPGYPADMDWSIFNAASPDQWIKGFWDGGEEFVIRGMHPEKETLLGHLPALRPRIFLNIRTEDGERFQELETRLDTVWLFPGQEKGVLVHRAGLEIASWDGLELAHMLMAFELANGQSRPAEDYQASLARRLDKKQAVYWLLREDDLTPPEGLAEGEDDELALNLAKPESPLAKAAKARAEAAKAKAAELKQQVLAKHQEAAGRINQALAKVRQSIGQQVENPEPHLAKLKDVPPLSFPPPSQPPQAPVPPKVTGLADLPALMDFLQNLSQDLKTQAQAQKAKAQGMAKEAKAQAMAKKAEAEAKYKDVMAKAQKASAPHLEKNGGSWEEAMAKAKAAPPPDPVAQLKALSGKLKDQPEAQAQLDDLAGKVKGAMGKVEEFKAKAASLQGGDSPAADPAVQAQINKARAVGAHVLPRPELPEMEQRLAAGRQAVADHQAGQSLAGRDLTGAILAGADLAKADLSAAILESADLSQADLSGANLSLAVLSRAKAGGARLAGANLAGANLGKADLSKADLSKADLNKAVLSQADLSGANLAGANLAVGILQKANLAGAKLQGATAPKVVFHEADLSQADLSDGDFQGASFIQARMAGADFSRALLNKALLVEVKAAGCRFDQAQMDNVRLAMQADLSGSSLKGINSPHSNWRESNLNGADFSGAVLDESDFGRCHLAGANFHRASAQKSQFTSCDLTEASLVGINLMEGSLMRARLIRTDLTGCNLFGANLMGAMWSEARLDQAYFKRTQLEQGDQ